MNKVLFLLLLVLVFRVNAQDYFSVIAENGLWIRTEPSLKSGRIEQLSVGQDILIVEKTGIRASINENDEKIDGEWYKIAETKGNKAGYVFSGYLLEKKENQNNGFNRDGKYNRYTKVSFEKFDLKIYNYRIQENITKKKDTIQVFEYVFNEIGDKLLHIIPKQKKDSISVAYTIVENINEQYNYREIKSTEFDNWNENRVRWKGQEEFANLNNKFNFFRIPTTQYEQKEVFRKQNLQLRDTLIDLSGESSNIATLIYKGKPCTYGLGPVILRIELYSENGEKSTKYLTIDLSYGC